MLWHWQIVLPALSTLEEMVTMGTTRVPDELYARIASSLTPEFRQALDEVLTVPSGEGRSTLCYLKEYPPEASTTVILRYIERYHFLRELGVGAITLRRVRLPMARYLAELAQRYDVRALRRFAPDKRYALTACFLVEIQKTILDYIVALHDQLLTRKRSWAQEVQFSPELLPLSASFSGFCKGCGALPLRVPWARGRANW
jgi:hypothetical protein